MFPAGIYCFYWEKYNTIHSIGIEDKRIKLIGPPGDYTE